MRTVQIITLLAFFSFFATHADAQESVPFKSNVVRINAGYALTGTKKLNFSPWGKDYGSKIKGGSSLHFNYSHLWQGANKNKAWGVGMEYQILNASSKTYTLKESGDIIKDKITIQYIAPQIASTFFFAKPFSFDVNVGIGYMRYHDDGKKNNKSCVTNANGFGANLAFNFEYYASPSISITAGAGATFGFFGKLKQTYEGKKETIDLNSDYEFNPSHADFTIGVRYHW